MSENNILLAVLALGAIMMFMSSDDKKEKKTKKKQAAAGNTKQAKADNPTQQQKFERQSAISAMQTLYGHHAGVRKFMSSNQTEIERVKQFPPDTWTQILEMQKEIIRLGLYAQQFLFRNVENSEDTNFWRSFDEVYSELGAFHQIELGLRANQE